MGDSSNSLALVLSIQEAGRVKMQPLFAYDLNSVAAANDPRGEVVKTKKNTLLPFTTLLMRQIYVDLVILSKVVPVTMGKTPLPPIQQSGGGLFLVEDAFNDETSSSISSTCLEQEWVQEQRRRRSWVYQGGLQNVFFLHTKQIFATKFDP